MTKLSSRFALFAIVLSLSACGGDDDNRTANDTDTEPYVGDVVIDTLAKAVELDSALVCDSAAVAPSRLSIAEGVATLGAQQFELAKAANLKGSFSRSALDDFGVTTLRFEMNDGEPDERDAIELRITNSAQLEKVSHITGSTTIACTASVPVTLASPLFALDPDQRLEALYAIPQKTHAQDMSCAVGPSDALPAASTYHAVLENFAVTATPVTEPSAQTLAFDLKPIGTFNDFEVYPDRGASFSSVSNLGQLTLISRVSPSGEPVELSRRTRTAEFVEERCDRP